MVSKWTKEEKIEMVKAFCVLETIQKCYGKIINPQEILAAWEFVLGEKYTANQVMHAMKTYMEKSSDMPSPADLIKVMTPPEPRITYEQYKHALKQHSIEGYPRFGYYGQMIKDYEKQQGMHCETPSFYEVLEKRQSSERMEIKGPDDVVN